MSGAVLGALLRKEAGDLLHRGTDLRQLGLAMVVLVVAGAGVTAGLPGPTALATRPAALLALLPVLFMLPAAAQAFAGERDRRTLDTLLTLPAPVGVLFAAKVLLVGALGGLGAGAALLGGVVGAALWAHPQPVSGRVLAGTVALAATGIVCFATAGVAVSACSASARGALLGGVLLAGLLAAAEGGVLWLVPGTAARALVAAGAAGLCLGVVLAADRLFPRAQVGSGHRLPG